MPRIDPVQLLKCLSVLLSTSGGIKSKDEVQRLASLMTKFSKKLVSKCIYIQILKRTETELLGSFMGAGGWNLVHLWLTDGIIAKNWPLIQELLELLLLCPVDIERLKSNNCPKLVKELSKEETQTVIQVLATKLVEQWLKLVKGEPVPPLVLAQLPHLVSKDTMLVDDEISNIKSAIEDGDSIQNESSDLGIESAANGECSAKSAEQSEGDGKTRNQIPILKISVKDGKQVVSKLSDKKESHRRHSDADKKSRLSVDGDSDKKDSDRKSDSSKSGSSGSRSSSKHKHSRSSSSSSDHRHSSSSSSKSHRHSSSSSSKDSDKNKDKKHSDRDKSSDKSKESADKNKDSDKSKDPLKRSTSSDKSKPPSIMKLGKIPKKSDRDRDKKEDDAKKEKPSISIEVRKPTDDRPKTVKTFNSKFRSHGLEEEARPPPPRGAVKKPPTPTLPPTVGPIVPKRPSPIRTTEAPPEKRAKLTEGNERPGAIKLIPPKPKPSYLLESGSFMDALAASATNKKEPRKRKRRMSGSKENSSLNENSPPSSPNASISSLPTTPQEESKPAPLRFYQDTLDTEEEDKEKNNAIKSPTEDKTMSVDNPASPASPMKVDKEPGDATPEESFAESEVETVAPTGLKGVLCVHKKKGPKKSLRWRDSNLEDVKYFELDETERVNVTKTFLDMKQMEHTNEREAMKKGRDMESEDTMEERMMWRKLEPIDSIIVIEYGKNSTEKVVQAKRHACVLQALYFHKSMIPDSPAEADFESHPNSEPTTIPLDDVNGNPESVNDFQNTPWPEPKGGVPPPIPSQGQQMFQQMPPFNPGFNGPPFGMPGFPGGMMPNGPPPDWQMNGPNMMMHPDNMNPDMGPGPMYPGMGPGPMYPGPMGDFNMMDNMNGPNMNGPNFQPGFMGPNGPMGPGGMNRPMGPPGPGGPPVSGGPPGPYFNNNRGGMRGGPPSRGGSNMHWRTNGNWNGPHRGGNKMRGKGRVCAHFMKRGSCRDGDACQFLHHR